MLSTAAVIQVSPVPHSAAAAEAAGRPVRHLASPQQSKEELARKIAHEDGIASGLIAVFSAVEPCLSYTVRADRQSKEKHLVLEPRKCPHLSGYTGVYQKQRQFRHPPRPQHLHQSHCLATSCSPPSTP
jgi:hypothetical protein